MQNPNTRADQAWREYRWVMWVLVLVVTAAQIVRLLTSWYTYSTPERFDAVAFTLALIALPWSLVLHFRKGRPLPTELLATFAYVLLMLSTVLGR